MRDTIPFRLNSAEAIAFGIFNIRQKRVVYRSLLVIVIVTALTMPRPAMAQSNDAKVEALTAEVQELRALVDQLLKAKSVQEEQAQADDLTSPERTPNLSLARNITTPESGTIDTPEAEDKEASVLSGVLSDRQPIGRFPDDAFVTAGNFDGAISVPGINGSFRIGGSVQVNMNYDPDNKGLQFIGAQTTIPLDGDPSNGTDQFGIHARFSRFNFDYRAPTKFGQLRTFLEFDMFGDGDQFTNDYDVRLRHAGVELGNWRFGQYHSGFIDVYSIPESADPGGPLGVPILRQPGIYYTRGDPLGSNWGIGIENPAADLGGNTGLIASESIPNLVAFGRLQRDWGYVRLAVLGLQLKSTEDQTFTGGAHLSGRINTPFTGEHGDNLSFGIQYGDGFVHYYSSFVGELDGVIDENGTVEATGILGGFVGYQHFWSKRWRSTFKASIFELDSPNGADPLAYSGGYRLGANLFVTPIDGITFGLEGIYNTVETVDGSEGEGVRIEAVARFDF